jgi:hypothetical protein
MGRTGKQGGRNLLASGNKPATIKIGSKLLATEVCVFDFFKAFLDIAKSLLGLSEQLKAAKRQRREDLAKLFEGISGCLADIATQIGAGDGAHGKCGELLTYAQALPDAIRADVGDAQAAGLGTVLNSALGMRSAVSQLNEAAKKDACLQVIQEASGKFKALANLVRIQ